MPKVAIISAVWGRFALTRLWWPAVVRIQRAFEAVGVEACAVIGGSQPEHAALCQEHGGVWVQAENSPLGAKWNRVASVALALGADYLFITGQDDFYSDALITDYARQARIGTPYVALSQVYFYDFASQRVGFFSGYPTTSPRHGESVGAGRMLARRFWTRPDPWEPGLERGLDGSMTQRLRLPKPLMFGLREDRVAVDVKTSENLWPFNRMALSFRDNFTVSPAFLRFIPELPPHPSITTPGCAPGSIMQQN